jgi:hypothetical protein
MVGRRSRLRGCRLGASAPRRGSMCAWIGLAVPLVIGMVVVAVDIGQVALCRYQLKSAADAAALAAASVLRDTSSKRAASSAAVCYAAQNRALDAAVAVDPMTDVHIGSWDASRHCISRWSPRARVIAVQVRARRPAGSPGGPFISQCASRLGMRSTGLAVSSTAVVRRAGRRHTPVIVAPRRPGASGLALVTRSPQASSADKRSKAR